MYFSCVPAHVLLIWLIYNFFYLYSISAHKLFILIISLIAMCPMLKNKRNEVDFDIFKQIWQQYLSIVPAECLIVWLINEKMFSISSH